MPKNETRNRGLILVVDDSRENSVRARYYLKKAGFDVVTAGDALSAIDLAIEHPPAAIVSDYLMPIMNGFAFCQRLRGIHGLARVPFIIASAWDFTRAEQETAKRIGVSSIVLISPDYDTVIAAVDSLLWPNPAA